MCGPPTHSVAAVGARCSPPKRHNAFLLSRDCWTSALSITCRARTNVLMRTTTRTHRSVKMLRFKLWMQSFPLRVRGMLSSQSACYLPLASHRHQTSEQMRHQGKHSGTACALQHTNRSTFSEFQGCGQPCGKHPTSDCAAAQPCVSWFCSNAFDRVRSQPHCRNCWAGCIAWRLLLLLHPSSHRNR